MNNKRILTAITFLIMLTTTLNAQVKIPPASSSQTIIQSLGTKNITLTYSRPSMNGRKVFGGLEPWDKVWRTGANQIPTIKFDGEISFNGHLVAPGTYGILTIPGKKQWTVILSKNSEQWGAYTYKQSEDLLRFTVTPQKPAAPIETFIMGFSDVSTTSAKLFLGWENSLIAFELTVDEDKEIMASIDQAMNSERKPYFQAAQYYYKNNKDINKALEWVNEAEKTNQSAPYIKYWKALIQLKAGDKQGAISTAQAGKALAAEANNDEYVKLTQQVIDQAGRQ